MDGLADVEDLRPLPGEVVWFLLPLPRPLPVPDGFTFEHFNDGMRHGAGPIFAPPEKTVSLRIHQLEEAVDDGGRNVAVFDLAGLTLPPLDDGPLLQGRARHESGATIHRLQGTLTVVETAVSIRRMLDTQPLYTDGLSLSLNAAIWAVQDLQRACALHSGEPIRPLSIGQLPLAVPYAIGEVRGGPSSVEWGIFPLSPTNILNEPRSLSDTASEAEVARAHGVVHSGPLAIYWELALEARWLVVLEDEPRLGLIAAASAAEAIADVVLAAMLVEERLEPDTAAAVMKKSFVQRLRSEYHRRLGGAWDDQRSGSVTQSLYRDVLRLRHKTVHGAHRPVPYEAVVALEAMEGFVDQLLHLVGSRSDTYPRTVWLLHEAGLLDGQIPDGVAELRVSEDLVDWGGIVERFAVLVARLAFDGPASHPTDDESGSVKAVVGADSTVELYAHHELSGYAALLRMSATPELLDELDQLGPPLAPVTVLTGLTIPHGVELSWVPDHEVLPGWEVQLPAGSFPRQG